MQKQPEKVWNFCPKVLLRLSLELDIMIRV